MTASETRLWAALRTLKLNIRRQAPLGRYVADFVHLAAKLVIEVDGPRHDLPDAQLHDAARDAWMQSQGFQILRIRDRDAFGRPEEVAKLVERHIKALPLEGGGLGGGARAAVSGLSEMGVVPISEPPVRPR